MTPALRHSTRWGMSAVFALTLALGVAALAVVAAQSGMKTVVLAMLLPILLLAALILRDAVVVLIPTLIFAISYNRQFYSFDDLIGDYGPAGLYWTGANAVLTALIAVALFSAATAPTPGLIQRRAFSIEPAVVALLLTMAVSTLSTNDIVPGVIEVWRITLFLLTFLLIRNTMNDDRHWAVLVGLGLMLAAQSMLGAVQVALGAGGAGLSSLSAQGGEMASRATGTLGHPNMYAPFLLLFTPGFVAAGILRSSGRLRLISLGLGIAGCLAIILSQSRLPVASLMLAIAGVALNLTLRGYLPLRRFLGGAAVALMLTTLATIPLMNKIVDRLTGDFGGSITFRADYNNAALAIWQKSPVVGVGPNSFVPHLAEVDQDLYAVNAGIQSARLDFNVKTIAPVHNVYLLILAELGLIGFGAFLLFLASLARVFHKASQGTAIENVFYLGVFWGFVGLLIQQASDFSLWWDHTMTMLAVLAASAAYIRDRGAET